MVAMDDGTGLQYFLSDHLGSVVAVTDSTGTLTSQQRYLPFGGVRSDVNAITQTDYGYTGQRNLDSGIGLMDYKARFYSPYLNRFIQPDSIVPSPMNPQSLNRFSYVFNNPLVFIDPSGHAPCILEPEECGFLQNNNPGSGSPITISDNSGSSSSGSGIKNVQNEFPPVTQTLLSTPVNRLDLTKFPLNGLYFGMDIKPGSFEEYMINCGSANCPINLPPDRPGNYYYDIWRVDAGALAWDYAGLIASTVGLRPVIQQLRLSRGAVETSQAVSFVASVGSFGTSAQKKDVNGIAISVVSFYPPAGVAASAAGIMNTLSEGYYFVPDPMIGPPAGPYCDFAGYGCR